MIFSRVLRTDFEPVLLGGLMLAAVAGYVNVVVIAVGGPPVTHVTGDVSRLSADVASGNVGDALMILSVLVAFVLGAAACGAIIGSATLRLGRRYGVAILCEALLLGLATIALPRSLDAGVVLAAAAAGLQNAMASSYRHLIVRTTHVTGIATDIGFHLGRMAAGHPTEPWRLLLLGGLLGAFFAGGTLGVVAFGRFGHAALLGPTYLLSGAGLLYFLWRRALLRRHRRSRSNGAPPV